MNLLENVTAGAVRPEPFPHLVLHDALPEDLVDRLVAEFPDDETVKSGEPGSPQGSNKRFNIYADAVDRSPKISPLWKRFIAEQSSARFFGHAVRIFEPWIREAYPDLLLRCDGNLGNLRTGRRSRDGYSECDVLLDAGISINTPVTALPSSVRMAHVDLPTKLFTGLFYLRPPEDRDSRGGELVICRGRPGVIPRFYRYEVDRSSVEEVETIPYRRNTFVFFLNSLRAVHAVTPRQRTRHTRRFVNLVVELEEPLFDSAHLQVAKVPYRLKYYLRQLASWRRAAR